MTVIRVNPESVQQYGREAQRIFDAMHTALVTMVNEAVGVHYYGPNAVAFKTECGRLAAEFANALHTDLQQMATAVRTSTSNIAAALGGGPISIPIDGRAITPPTPPTVDYVDVDTTALEAFVPTVEQRFEALRQGLNEHLSRLQATDWTGNAKLAAVDAVGSYTTSARGKCDSAQTSVTAYIRSQLDAVLAADR
jgi:hypothetical protein